ncbi:MAG: M3 family oligoendopeptidase, partial [Firmicutes bacterium]|nr:M3 family oligoendopeptidase [Bacillota bacterium]
MKFTEFPYERPEISDYEKHMTALIDAFAASQSAQEQLDMVAGINKLRSEFASMRTIASIRHSIDTADEFYEAEQAYYDEVGPIVQKFSNHFYQILLSSPFRDALEAHLGPHLFKLAQVRLRTFSDVVLEDLKHENRLTTEYGKLMSSARILFEGEERTLAQLSPFQQSKDRDMCKRAYEARAAFMKENEAQLDRIYDDLVRVRTDIAHKLGFPNFVELGYLRMGRTDYGPELVSGYREQVLISVVPLVTKLKERQRKRIGVDQLRYYDESLQYLTGNAMPQGDADFILGAGARMYKELSPETEQFFEFMRDHELMDLVSKP